MMNIGIKLPFQATCIFLFVFWHGQSYCESNNHLDKQIKALDKIQEFAGKICTSIPNRGDATELELSGKGKADLNKLIKNFVDIGIEGAAKYNNSKWQGVLQQDIAPLISDNMNCRLEVLRILQDKLIPSISIETSLENKQKEKHSIVDALKNNKYELGWSNSPLGLEDKKFNVVPVKEVEINNNFAIISYGHQGGDGMLRLTIGSRSLVGQWNDSEGSGEIGLIFDQSFGRATGWWNYGGQTKKYNSFMRRVQ